MGKKKDDDEFDVRDDEIIDTPVTYDVRPPPRSRFPAFDIGDVLAILTLVVLSAALLLEGFHKDFRDYSKEIVALFAIVVGFLLGRKT